MVSFHLCLCTINVTLTLYNLIAIETNIIYIVYWMEKRDFQYDLIRHKTYKNSKERWPSPIREFLLANFYKITLTIFLLFCKCIFLSKQLHAIIQGQISLWVYTIMPFANYFMPFVFFLRLNVFMCDVKLLKFLCMIYSNINRQNKTKNAFLLHVFIFL